MVGIKRIKRIRHRSSVLVALVAGLALLLAACGGGNDNSSSGSSGGSSGVTDLG